MTKLGATTKYAQNERLERIDHALSNAALTDEFVLNYQPIISLKERSIVGAEALLRWYSPDLGTVSPNEFIPRAESTGMIVPIGKWVLRTACVEAKRWMSIGSSPVGVGVNFSAVQVGQDGLVEFVENTLAATDLPPRLLNIELTEHSLSPDPARALQSVVRLKELGVSISLDDFGIGYSSFSKLISYPVDTLKIDQSFIAGLVHDRKAIAIVRAIAQIGHDLSLSILAEGTDRLEQIEFLSDLGCDYAQGHFFYESMTGEELRRLLSSGN